MERSGGDRERGWAEREKLCKNVIIYNFLTIICLAEARGSQTRAMIQKGPFKTSNPAGAMVAAPGTLKQPDS